MGKEFANRDGFPTGSTYSVQTCINELNQGDDVSLSTGDGSLSCATEQERRDAAVRHALGRLEEFLYTEGRMPEDVRIFFCDDPQPLGISFDDMILIEHMGYQNAGYGQRAEGERFLEDAFRGYHEHGPLRFVLVTAQRPGTTETRRLLAFFDFFYVSEHLTDEENAYVDAASGWEEQMPDLRPRIYIISKLVADPGIPRAAAALPGRAVAVTLQALADVSKEGIYVEAIAQPATQRFVGRHLKTYIPGLQILLNQKFGGSDERTAPSKLLVYIPALNTEGSDCE